VIVIEEIRLMQYQIPSVDFYLLHSLDEER